MKYDSSLDTMVFLHPSVDFTGEKKKRMMSWRSSTSYLIGGGSIAGGVCSQVGELLLQLVVGAVAEAVHHGGGQQHADDAQDGDDGEDEELGRLGLAVLGGDLVDLASLWEEEEEEQIEEG